MCNDYQCYLEYEVYCHLMQDLTLGIPTQQSELDMPPMEDVRINDVAPAMRTKGNVVELAPMQWSFPASRPGARPVFNFRGEGRKFQKEDRVIIPASGFYEFTGTKSPKNKWLFTDAPEKELIKPLPAGALSVKLYRRGKDELEPKLLARTESA